MEVAFGSANSGEAEDGAKAERAVSPVGVIDREGAATPESLIFSKYGDLELILTYPDGREVIALVSSSCMSEACTLWDKFIHPPFSTVSQDDNDGSKNSSPKIRQIPFRDENAEALIILLHMAHLQHDNVPNMPTFECLANIAVLCDKYSCFRLIRPWTLKWIEHWEPIALENGYCNWLFIAWVFGRAESFEALSLKLVCGISVFTTDDGEDHLSYNHEGLGIFLLLDPLEHILKIRERVLQNILDTVYNEFEKFRTWDAPALCSKIVDREVCAGAMSGSFLRELSVYELFPKIRADAWTLCVDDLMDRVKGMVIRKLHKHSSCSLPDWDTLFASIISNIPSLIDNEHRRHLKDATGNREELVCVVTTGGTTSGL